MLFLLPTSLLICSIDYIFSSVLRTFHILRPRGSYSVAPGAIGEGRPAHESRICIRSLNYGSSKKYILNRLLLYKMYFSPSIHLYFSPGRIFFEKLLGANLLRVMKNFLRVITKFSPSREQTFSELRANYLRVMKNFIRFFTSRQGSSLILYWHKIVLDCECSNCVEALNSLWKLNGAESKCARLSRTAKSSSVGTFSLSK